MNNLKLLLIALCCITLSCSKTDENLDLLSEQNVKVSDKHWVDTETPKSVKPNFTNNAFSSKTANLNTAIYDNTEWEAVWSDEFNNSTLDTSKWIKSSENNRSIGAGRAANGITRWYWEQDNINFDGSNLLLDVHKIGTGTLTGASVETRGKHEFKYGYYEVNVNVAETVKGTHTAFWLQSSNQGNIDDSGRDGAEIDVFESAYQPGEKVQVAMHYDGYGSEKGNVSIQYATPGIHQDAFHTFGMHWRKDSIDIYYDGAKVNSLNPNKSFPISTALNGDPVVPEVPEWLWLSTGASWEPTDFANQAAGYLTTAKVDYVRVFKLKPKENTFFRITNKASNAWLRTFGDASGSEIKQNNNTYGNWTTWKVIPINNSDDYFIQNEGTGMYIKQKTLGQNFLIAKPSNFTGNFLRWEFIDAGGDGYFYIKNRKSGKYLKSTGTGNALRVLVEDLEETDWFKWRLH